MEPIPVWDVHADVLWRVVMEKADFFHPASPLSAGWHNLRRGGVRVLGFPLFVPPDRPAAEGWNLLLQQIITFHDRIVCQGDHVVPLLYREDAVNAETGTAVHGLLCLEGCYALEGSVERLSLCMHLGVRVVGLTWNEANLLADGVGESRGGGLTALGRQFVKEVWKRSGIVDVAHLGEAGFWEVVREAQGPVICSHANVKAVWPHRRNLSDAQLRALAELGGVFGLTFVPEFVGPSGNVDDLLRHVDHALAVVGDRHVAFGSDFDGIVDRLDGLETAAHYPSLERILVDRYGRITARRLLWENWKAVFSRFLPPRPNLRRAPN
ncbi:MAG: membrane dipeptidase [Alicyclobacillaceae bacterium]|nr:membrane dipeptidase [Alicyclobacillaceae bacterium]